MIARIKALFATFGASEPVVSEAAGVDELHLAAAALLARLGNDTPQAARLRRLNPTPGSGATRGTAANR